MTNRIAYLPTELERRLILKAGAHACPNSKLTPDARWAHRDVTDESVARVLLALHSGVELYASVHGRWYAPSGSPLNGLTLSKTIQECIRTGLLIHHVSGALILAPVHLGTWDENAACWVSRCHVVGENMGPKRVRLVEDQVAADCAECLDQL